MARYEPVDPQQSFPDLEQEILERWRERDVFHESIRRREGAEPYVFYEGPPTANGRPGSHHVLSRVFKDVFPRYRTMRGRLVHRKGGWDTHGLPVELEIEKELGFKTKDDIEAYGVAEFNAKCRESVLQVHRRVAPADRADRLLDRHRRRLLHDGQRLHRVGLVVAQAGVGQGPAVRGLQGRALLPALRHRAVLARGRRWATRTWSTRRRSCASRSLARSGVSFVGWTTTPWTLLSNAALAVGPDIPYVRVEHEGEQLIVAQALAERVFGEGVEIVGPGARLGAAWAWPTSRRSRSSPTSARRATRCCRPTS